VLGHLTLPLLLVVVVALTTRAARKQAPDDVEDSCKSGSGERRAAWPNSGTVASSRSTSSAIFALERRIKLLA
jgi:hypothetical protein